MEEARLERNVSLKVILRESCLLWTEFSREKKIRPSPPGTEDMENMFVFYQSGRKVGDNIPRV